MDLIPLPKPVSIEAEGQNKYRVTLEPLYPGYGVTIGNAMRRVLLASLPGSAITAVKIKFVDHEFSTVPNVKEDVIQIILALKNIKLRSQSAEPVRLRLQVKGEAVVTAANIQKHEMVEIYNTDAHIATLDGKNAELDMELIVEQGRGYVPVEAREDLKLEIGFLAIDAIYTPIRAVFYDVSNVRVGQYTNYDKLSLVIETNGTISGQEATDLASKILIDHFKLMLSTTPELEGEVQSDAVATEDGEEADEEAIATGDDSFDSLILSNRAKNALQKAGITSRGQLDKLSAEEIENIEGLGKKTVVEILTALGR